VRVRAAEVGSTDLTMLAGRYSFAPNIPFVPGYEIAGVVEAVGPSVRDLPAFQGKAPIMQDILAHCCILTTSGHSHPLLTITPGGGSIGNALSLLLCLIGRLLYGNFVEAH
jgi:NADPH:quinone reductase-like Zn-dependent oxidoreductase